MKNTTAFICSLALPVLYGFFILLPKTVFPATVTIPADAESVLPGRELAFKLFPPDQDPGSERMVTGAMDGELTNHADGLNFGVSDSILWARFTLTHESAHKENWLVEIGYPPLDLVELYIVRKNGVVEVNRGGDTLPFSERPVKHRNLVFPVQLEKGEVVTVYLRAQTTSAFQVPIVLWSPEGFLKKDHEEQYAFGIYYGILFVMLLYNFFIFFTVRDGAYLYYVFFIVGLMGTAMGMNGHAYEYVWPDAVWWNNRAIAFLAAGGFTGMLFYTRSLLTTAENSKKLDRLLFLGLIATAALCIGSLFVPYRIIVKMGGIVGLYDVVLVLVSGGVRWKDGYRPARYFVLAWSVFLLFSIVTLLRVTAVLPNNFITVYGFQIASVGLVLLLSFALADRINLMKQEKEAAQAHAIETQKRELDARLGLMNSFFRFVPGEFLKLMGKDNITEIELGDALLRKMTVLFTDIRDFTSLSESMTPEDNFRFLNSFLKRMEPSIERNHGFVDKFVGDAIMALFSGTPDAALHAAVEMIRELKNYNALRTTQGFRHIAIGIGINYGEMMLGTVGSANRLDTTVIGNSVNLASRLEALTKTFRVPILITDFVYRALANAEEFCLREVDRVTVRGKTEPVIIYEVFDADPPELIAQKKSIQNEIIAALVFYKLGRFEKALEMLKLCREGCPTDPITEIYTKRCEHYRDHPPESSWTGISRI